MNFETVKKLVDAQFPVGRAAVFGECSDIAVHFHVPGEKFRVEVSVDLMGETRMFHLTVPCQVALRDDNIRSVYHDLVLGKVDQMIDNVRQWRNHVALWRSYFPKRPQPRVRGLTGDDGPGVVMTHSVPYTTEDHLKELITGLHPWLV